MNKIILGILLGITLLPACKKSGPTIIHDGIDGGLIMHYNYNVGSYWVYIDSLTGDVDSFYVKSNQFSSQKVNDQEYTDNIHIQLQHFTKTPTSYRDTFGWDINLYRHQINLSADGYIYTTLLTYPVTIGSIPIYGSPNNDGVVIQIISNVSLKNNTFNNVYEIYDTSAYPSVHFYDWFYINDSIGFIKIKMFHPSDTINRIWELERWKIVK